MHLAPPVATAALLLALVTPVSAVTLGQSDTFATGVQGWFAGGAQPGVAPAVPPQVQPGGGPGGAGDAFLVVTSIGGGGPGSRLVAMNASQWAGNYTAAGVLAIEMDLRNFGDTEIAVRLLLEDPQGAPPSNAAVSSSIVLPPGSGWTHARFGIGAGALTTLSGDPQTLLSATTLLRVFHGPAASFPGPASAALLGIDNIAAVPEPATALLAALGVATLMLRRRRPPA